MLESTQLIDDCRLLIVDLRSKKSRGFCFANQQSAIDNQFLTSQINNQQSAIDNQFTSQINNQQSAIDNQFLTSQINNQQSTIDNQ